MRETRNGKMVSATSYGGQSVEKRRLLEPKEVDRDTQLGIHFLGQLLTTKCIHNTYCNQLHPLVPIRHWG